MVNTEDIGEVSYHEEGLLVNDDFFRIEAPSDYYELIKQTLSGMTDEERATEYKNREEDLYKYLGKDVHYDILGRDAKDRRLYMALAYPLIFFVGHFFVSVISLM